MTDLSSIFGAGFDTNSVPPQDDFEVLPPGKYPVMIDKVEVRQTKAGTGYYISLTLTVLDGTAKNRKLFDNINIANPSDKCVEIGLRQLAALGKAVGLQAITDTSELLNRYCLAHVKVKDNANDIRTYSAFDQQFLDTSIATQPPPQQYPPVQAPIQQWVSKVPYQQPQQPASIPLSTSGQPGKPPWAR